ncbi:hypothetical protein PtB15_18B45 [Puccinia triticina]|nr:hypothetical protein PtB15_18B45 [Puccinia triticina]
MSASERDVPSCLPACSQPLPPHSQEAPLPSSSYPGYSQLAPAGSRKIYVFADDIPSSGLISQEDFKKFFSGENKDVCLVQKEKDPLCQNPEFKIDDDERFGRVESESPPRDLNPQGVGGSRSSQDRSPSPVPARQRSPPVSPQASPPPAPRLYSRPSPSAASSLPLSSQSTGLERPFPRRTSPKPSSSIPSKFADACPSSTADTASKAPSPEVLKRTKSSRNATRAVSASHVSSSSAVPAKRSISAAFAPPAKRAVSASTAGPSKQSVSTSIAGPSTRRVSAVATRPAKRSASTTSGPPTKRSKPVGTAPDGPRMTRSVSRQELRPARSQNKAKAEEPLPPPAKRKRSRIEAPLPSLPKRKTAKLRGKRTLSGTSAKETAGPQNTDENRPISQPVTRATKPCLPPLSASQGTDIPVRRVSARLQSKRARSNSQNTI